MIKSFIFPILLAFSGMALLSMALPAEPEDPLPNDVQQYVHTEVKLVEGVEPDEDVDDDEEDDSNGVQDRILPRVWCRLKCAPICIAQPNATCVCTKTFLGIFPLFTINLPCC
ncbi:hypothetical protein TCAL_12799 [Tigriopus californicus]|uniref:Invertebrate defensins family profile domain-containing protein n=1 Tax=Tigriopus californicus TaxID=6832 RepID=A0A553PRP1_TIGCA|nr:uncharacterized protein LOC131891665 [Tigriopus californicus]TRY80340.1 hypothetical protein TCAL_12799 [Tigriopus californicus]|eukprot:TCALIF_12799-PA protein Name:"Protein of unknown function" AED:0.00 eAED:0.00 QI:0/1/0.5/1/1/1/2/62/112